MTYKVVLRAIVILWITGAAVTCLPFANFGLFYNSEIGCLRYRDATEMKDIIYAYIFFVFGKYNKMIFNFLLPFIHILLWLNPQN